MQSSICKTCTYCLWLVGIGQGVRCNQAKNQLYKNDNSKAFVTISQVPDNCKYFEAKGKKDGF